MPTVSVVNPRRAHKRRSSRNRKRSRSRGRSFSSRVRSAIAPLLKGGNVSRKRRKRNRSSRRRRTRVRHRNPVFAMARPRRRSRRSHARRANRHHRRSHRNPSILGLNMSELLAMTAGGVGNGIITRSVPQLLLGTSNTGVMGYGANAAAAFAGAWIIKAMFGARAGTGAIIGGATALVQRIMSDLMGSKLGDLGLSGDLDFDLGFYIGNSFPLPTAGSGPYLLNPGYSGSPMPSVSVGGPAIVPAALPAGAAGAVAQPDASGGGHGDGTGRWGNRWAA
jgi:hypothetical protein